MKSKIIIISFFCNTSVAYAHFADIKLHTSLRIFRETVLTEIVVHSIGSIVAFPPHAETRSLAYYRKNKCCTPRAAHVAHRRDIVAYAAWNFHKPTAKLHQEKCLTHTHTQVYSCVGKFIERSFDVDWAKLLSHCLLHVIKFCLMEKKDP